MQAMGKMEGFGILDLTNESTLMLSDQKTEFEYSIDDRTLEIHFPFDKEKILRLRICELATDKLIVAVSAKTADDKLNKELVELEYAPIRDNDAS